MTVGNNGPDKATSVVVRADVPSEVAFVSATSDQGSCTESNGTIACSIGNIESNGSANITVVLAAKVEAQVTQSAGVFGNEVDPIGANFAITATTEVTAETKVVATPTPTATPLPGVTPVPTPTIPATVEVEPTPTVVATKPPVISPTVRATDTPVLSPTEVPKPEPTETKDVVEATPVLVAKPTDTPVAQIKPTAEPTDTPAVAAAATTPPTYTPTGTTGCSAPASGGPVGMEWGMLLMLVVGMVFWKKHDDKNANFLHLTSQ
ncbi:MAG: hypothetical protein OSB07_10645 [Dehalococcoidia bacterium]|nr:hypothetical protein [Dehalococcoidia bacterium]